MKKAVKKEIISVVIPCYNEEDNIGKIYKRLNKVSKELYKYEFEIIYIDDGSQDYTLNRIRDLSILDKRIKYISFSRNFGKEAAMLAGLKYTSGEYVTIMDCDLQDPPEILKEMMLVLENSLYDVVGIYSDNHNDYGSLRKFLTKKWYKFYEYASSRRQMPGERDCRLMRRKAVNAILSLNEYNRFTKGIFSYVGFETYWIDYEIPNRKNGKSKFSLFKLFKYAIEGMVAFSTTPLVVSALVGSFFCLVAFIAILIIIVKTMIFGDPVGGWPSLACIIIFVGGIQLFFLGVFGLYLSKIYLEVKNRPLYIINETEKDLQNIM